MSSSNSAARAFEVRQGPVGNPALTRARVLRGLTFSRGASPLDAELPGPAAEVDPALVASLGDVSGAVTVIADPAVEPGGCILEVGDSRIDAQLGSALDRVRAALMGER